MLPPASPGEDFIKFESPNCFIKIKDNDPKAIAFAQGVIDLLKGKEKQSKDQGK